MERVTSAGRSGNDTTSGDGLHLAEIEAGLRSSRTHTFEAAVKAAVMSGAAGDSLLAELDDLRGWRALHVTVALGDVDGPRGSPVLRRVIAARGGGTSNLRCAAVLALAKREKVGASKTLSEAVDDADVAVRGYAVLGLAAVGDGRAWDAVAARLKAMLARQRARDSEPSAVVGAVVYLLRHITGDPERAATVVSLLRRRWTSLFDDERLWFAEHWPSVDPNVGDTDEPELPNPVVLQRWLLDHPLFAKPAIF